MPKRKTSIGPQQLDCSDGAKMLIDQMKEHPEFFRGYGEFRSMLEMAQDVVRGVARNMSKRDAHAIMTAAETHLYEVWLAEDVLTNIMQPKEEPAQYQEAMRLGSSGTLGIGIRAPGKSVLGQVTGAAIANSVYANGNLTAACNASSSEYAMRNTKPFKDLL